MYNIYKIYKDSMVELRDIIHAIVKNIEGFFDFNFYIQSNYISYINAHPLYDYHGF